MYIPAIVLCAFGALSILIINIYLFAIPFKKKINNMPNDQNGHNPEEVPLERIVLSNMYSLEALIDVLVEKGLVTKEEVLKRMEKVGKEPRPVFGGPVNLPFEKNL